MIQVVKACYSFLLSMFFSTQVSLERERERECFPANYERSVNNYSLTTTANDHNKRVLNVWIRLTNYRPPNLIFSKRSNLKSFRRFSMSINSGLTYIKGFAEGLNEEAYGSPVAESYHHFLLWPPLQLLIGSNKHTGRLVMFHNY